jgi:hypothetical protein
MATKMQNGGKPSKWHQMGKWVFFHLKIYWNATYQTIFQLFFACKMLDAALRNIFNHLNFD